MKQLLMFLLAVFSVVFLNVQSQPDGYVLKLTKDQMSNTKGTYCGPNLANTLSVLCRGRYNTRLQVKKSYNTAFDYNDVLPQPQFGEVEEPFLEYPFISKEASKSIFSHRLRKRGIIDECCIKPCSIWELYSYCR